MTKADIILTKIASSKIDFMKKTVSTAKGIIDKKITGANAFVDAYLPSLKDAVQTGMQSPVPGHTEVAGTAAIIQELSKQITGKTKDMLDTGVEGIKHNYRKYIQQMSPIELNNVAIKDTLKKKHKG